MGELEGRIRRGGQPMSCKENTHDTMRNLDITTADAQNRERRTIIGGKRN